MRQRGFLLILAATALGSLLTALSLHQSLQAERLVLTARENARKSAEDRAASAAQEVEKLKAASGAADSLARKLEGVLGELKEKLERLEKELLARDLARDAGQKQVDTRLTELTAALGELKAGAAEAKAQAAAQSTTLTAKLDETVKARDSAAQLTGQVAALEAKLKEKETQIQSAVAERDRNAEDLKRRQSSLERLERDLSEERAKPRGGTGTTAGSPRVEDRAPPAVPVTTKVEAVEPSDGVVVLGSGKKSGLETGHVLSITRDGKSVGRVRVIKIYDDLAGAEILETAPGETVRRDDSASTGAATGTSTGVAPGAPPGPAPAAAPAATATPSPAPLPLTKRDPPPPPPGGNAGK